MGVAAAALDRACDGQHGPLAHGERTGQFLEVQVEPEFCERFLGLGPFCAVVDGTDRSALVTVAQSEVVDDIQTLDEAQFLVHKTQPGRLPTTGDSEVQLISRHGDLRTVVRIMVSGKNFDQCRLAAPVLPHQSTDFAGGKREIDTIEGSLAAESLREAADAERVCHVGLPT